MSSNNTIRNYKHDITGKFKDITMAISALDEDAFNNPENNEIFHAVHEVILKMVKTSRNTIAENLKQDIVLIVSDMEADLALPKLQIEGVTVRYRVDGTTMKYMLYTLENKGSVELQIEIVKRLLPIKETLRGI